VRINGKSVKPAQDVYPTDEISVRKNDIFYKMKVLDYPKSRVGAKKLHLYIHDTTPDKNLEKLDRIKESEAISGKKIKGRPTKKDRRELDDWFEDLTEDDI
jgi:ribosome-associated heat shock protein Hsp15